MFWTHDDEGESQSRQEKCSRQECVCVGEHSHCLAANITNHVNMRSHNLMDGELVTPDSEPVGNGRILYNDTLT